MNQAIQIQNLDGIIGPSGQCMCDHCQMDNLIDGIVKAKKEENNDQAVANIYQQVGE